MWSLTRPLVVLVDVQCDGAALLRSGRPEVAEHNADGTIYAVEAHATIHKQPYRRWAGLGHLPSVSRNSTPIHLSHSSLCRVCS